MAGDFILPWPPPQEAGDLTLPPPARGRGGHAAVTRCRGGLAAATGGRGGPLPQRDAGEAAAPPREAGKAALPLPQETREATRRRGRPGISRHRTHKAGEAHTAARALLERVAPPLTPLVEEGQRDESAQCRSV
jgi:hypothetical protein